MAREPLVSVPDMRGIKGALKIKGATKETRRDPPLAPLSLAQVGGKDKGSSSTVDLDPGSLPTDR